MSRLSAERPHQAMTAARHTAVMLEAWQDAGIVRADLAVRTAKATMLWFHDRSLDQLPLGLARARNVQQADIYIRPARGYPWPMVFLDDVARPMAQRIARHYAALVVQTSTLGGCHLWLRLTRALDEAQRCDVQRWLIPRVGADPGSVSGEHLGRLAGMKNAKRGGEWVNVLRRPSPQERVWDPTPALPTMAPAPPPVVNCAPRARLSTGDPSESAREWGWVCGALEAGLAPTTVYQRLLERASPRRGADAERYARYTLARAIRQSARGN
ncbi:DNA-primase RepB domain-containing protein [Thiorhodovibrio litoralis]|uniref:DNA-primase RepB domain-containing protein n=1 Tax=Thiorhodovibrio litoralis TaxID=2952932 RepID=UPI002B25FA3D|nr:DNA-primase RepB domain-containing protein [Thiorhodovibrio litoralis]WPL11960.1 DNA strand transferase [Thiorhodovibrio litoralis]WPL13321.1 DNA strand transferase [Thiorhodovibrio litoralis]